MHQDRILRVPDQVSVSRDVDSQQPIYHKFRNSDGYNPPYTLISIFVQAHSSRVSEQFYEGYRRNLSTNVPPSSLSLRYVCDIKFDCILNDRI